MTSPQPMAPHQDPSPQTDSGRVTMLEYVTTLIHTLDRRFDTLHQDLKDALAQRFADTDLRYQQRFDAQKEALGAALAAQKEAVSAALIAAEKAVEKANAAGEKRFDSVNEFRAQQGDIVRTFIPRAEAEARFTALSDKVDILTKAVTASQGRSAGSGATWGYIVAGVGVLIAVLTIALRLAGR
jgi:dsDNA-binding SOS-regulon protein